MKAMNNLVTISCCRRTKGTGDILMVVTTELSRAFGSNGFEAITAS